MKKLCLIVTDLYTGGAQTMLYKLLQKLDRSSFEPTVISLTAKGDIGARIEALSIPVYALGMSRGVPSLAKFLRLAGMLRKFSPDVVQTWMYHADLLGGLASRLAGLRVVAWGIRNSDLSLSRSKFSTIMVMRLCGWLSGWLPQRILSCSVRAQSVHVAAGYQADRFDLIPNGFDLERFVPDAAARISVRDWLGLPPDTPLVGLIARNDPQKNHTGFVDAAAKVKLAVPHVHFVLAGTGIDQDNSALLQAIEQRGMQESFHLLGQREDIPRLMASLDVLASSSAFGEAFPNVLGEAMACAVPCVVTDVGDSAEIVGSTGRVVAAGDMDGLGRHIIELLQLPVGQRSELGARARERVRSLFEIGDVARRYEHFYMQLLSGKNQGCAA